MTRDEIVAALRCCANSKMECKGNCVFSGTSSPNENCSQRKNTAAADLIENQQRHIEALMKANDSLKDAVVRCRDCRYYMEGEKLAPMKFCYRMGRLNRAPEDYCSRAERRVDDADQR